MKSWSLGVAAVVALAAGSATMAADFRIVNPGTNYRTGNGGEFQIVNTTANGGAATPLVGWGKTGMAADINANTFQTFCIELNENVSLGSNYFGKINTAAVMGGVGGGSPDPISEATAFLYSSFRKGTLAGYTYTPSPARATDARSLQVAIWFLENEITAANPEYAGNLTAQGWVAAALAWQAANPGNFLNVRAVNVFADAAHTDHRQDFLTIIPLPTAGGMAMAGLLGVMAIRRRVRI